MRILCIGDNPADAALMEAYLREYAAGDIQFHWEKRLEMGILRLREARFDAVLLDLGLPGTQGLATFTTYQQSGVDVPVIVVSDLEDRLIATEAVKLGAHACIVKSQLSDWGLYQSISSALAPCRVKADGVSESADPNACLMAISRYLEPTHDTSPDSSRVDAMVTDYARLLDDYAAQTGAVPQVDAARAFALSALDAGLSVQDCLAVHLKADARNERAGKGEIFILMVMTFFLDSQLQDARHQSPGPDHD